MRIFATGRKETRRFGCCLGSVRKAPLRSVSLASLSDFPSPLLVFIFESLEGGIREQVLVTVSFLVHFLPDS